MALQRGLSMPSHRVRRLEIAEAKDKLSEVLRDAVQGPLIIHRRGRNIAVVLAIEEYERLISVHESLKTGGSGFLQRVEALKLRHGCSVEDFQPSRLDFTPEDSAFS